MREGTLRSVIGSSLSALPWCYIAPAAFAASGVVTAGVGTALGSALPLFLVMSVAVSHPRALYGSCQASGPALGSRSRGGVDPAHCGFWGVSAGLLVLED